LSEAVAKLASITFSRLSLLSRTINLGFLTEGKSCCYIHHTFLLGFPTGWSSTTHQWYSWNSLVGSQILWLCVVLRCMTILVMCPTTNLVKANFWWNLPLLSGQWCWSESTHTSVRCFSCLSTQDLWLDTCAGHVVCLRCMSCWICAQHNLAMWMPILLLS
jgi:hypothetical protein